MKQRFELPYPRLIQLFCFVCCGLVPCLSLAQSKQLPAVSETHFSGIQSPTFEKFLIQEETILDEYFAKQPEVPIPVDPGGGYTHEKHKRNGIAIFEAGAMYEFTNDLKYAVAAADLLTSYAELYPSLGEHPVKESSVPGRMFWQVLNEAVWLVYAAQGYGSIKQTLSPEQRQLIEENLFDKLVEFLSVDSSRTFNRIHNHAAWAVAGVGITGFVLDNQDYIDRALNGSNRDRKSGFYALIDHLFSPDGYYAEGPYYQRYALMPFIVLARTISEYTSKNEVFDYKDRALIRAIYACIDLSYNGLFIPVNDAIKEKGLDTPELRWGIAIAYALTEDPRLVSIAIQQNDLVLTHDSLQLASAIDRGEAEPYQFKSRLFRDGPKGENGALAILRSSEEAHSQAVVLKASSHGFGHGHFDRLNVLYFDNNHEILSDYGAARFLNIPQKEGGRYLSENATWAKQSIAHNTLVVDETSHFQGDVKVADQYHPDLLQFQAGRKGDLVRARTSHAYKNVTIERLVALVDGVFDQHNLVVDILEVAGDGSHQYDLPLHFNGHFIDTNADLSERDVDSLEPFGEANGYQHLWVRATGTQKNNEILQLTWLVENRFYTLFSSISQPSSVFFTQLGANDPDFNLRPEASFIRRVKDAADTTFISVIETHGEYNGTDEYTLNSHPSLATFRYLETKDHQIIQLKTVKGEDYYLAFARVLEKSTVHDVTIGELVLSWQGFSATFDAGGNQI